MMRPVKILEPVSSKRDTLACVHIKDSDQPAHLGSLISLQWALYAMGSQGSNISSGGKLRQGSHRNSKTPFHDFSMIFNDQQYNFHDYLMHAQPPTSAFSAIFTTYSINAQSSNNNVFK